jgi:hypothetical protein
MVGIEVGIYHCLGAKFCIYRFDEIFIRHPKYPDSQVLRNFSIEGKQADIEKDREGEKIIQ